MAADYREFHAKVVKMAEVKAERKRQEQLREEEAKVAVIRAALEGQASEAEKEIDKGLNEHLAKGHVYFQDPATKTISYSHGLSFAISPDAISILQERYVKAGWDFDCHKTMFTEAKEDGRIYANITLSTPPTNKAIAFVATEPEAVARSAAFTTDKEE